MPVHNLLGFRILRRPPKLMMSAPKGSETAAVPPLPLQRLEELDQWLAGIGPIRVLACALAVKPLYFVLALAVAASFLFCGFTGELVCKALGVAYPAFQSFRALEDGSMERMQAQLMHWVVYGVFVVLIESAGYQMCQMVPCYHVFRLTFLIWLFLPSTQGSEAIYAWLVGPVLRKYRVAIEQILVHLFAQVHSMAGSESKADEGRPVPGVDDLLASELRKAASMLPSPSRELQETHRQVGIGSRSRNRSPRPAFLPPEEVDPPQLEADQFASPLRGGVGGREATGWH